MLGTTSTLGAQSGAMEFVGLDQRGDNVYVIVRT